MPDGSKRARDHPLGATVSRAWRIRDEFDRHRRGNRAQHQALQERRDLGYTDDVRVGLERLAQAPSCGGRPGVPTWELDFDSSEQINADDGHLPMPLPIWDESMPNR